jgi:hypothetical protein
MSSSPQESVTLWATPWLVWRVTWPTRSPREWKPFSQPRAWQSPGQSFLPPSWEQFQSIVRTPKPQKAVGTRQPQPVPHLGAPWRHSTVVLLPYQEGYDPRHPTELVGGGDLSPTLRGETRQAPPTTDPLLCSPLSIKLLPPTPPTT